MHSSRRWMITALAAAAVLLPAAGAQAQTKTVRLAKQFGISYLPLTIMEQKQLLEAQGKKLGLDLKTEWVVFTSGAPMNEAIISGNLDFASGGVGPLLTIWGKTRGNLGVKGVAALNSMPLYLNTINPNVKTIKDFTDKDRIALPAVRVSIQAITLQMAAEKAFGPGQHGKLDALTASLGHPDGYAAMMSGKSEITGHFTSAPFMYQELEDNRVRKVLDSYEVLGGPHTFNVIWATDQVPRRESQGDRSLRRRARRRHEADRRQSGRGRGDLGQGGKLQAVGRLHRETRPPARERVDDGAEKGHGLRRIHESHRHALAEAGILAGSFLSRHPQTAGELMAEAAQDLLHVEVWRGAAEGQLPVLRCAAARAPDRARCGDEIQREQDATLSYRFACRVGMCGSCAMVVNGRPRWTCRTRVSEAVDDDGGLRLEPLQNFTVVKDLAVEMTDFFDKWRDAKGYFEPSKSWQDLRSANSRSCRPQAPSGRRPTPASNASAAAFAIPPATWWRGTRIISDPPRSTAPGRLSTTCATAGNDARLDGGFRQRRLPRLPQPHELHAILPARRSRRPIRSRASSAPWCRRAVAGGARDARCCFVAQRASAGGAAFAVAVHLATILYAVRTGLTAGEVLDRTREQRLVPRFLSSVRAGDRGPRADRAAQCPARMDGWRGRSLDIALAVFALALLFLGVRAALAVYLPIAMFLR